MKILVRENGEDCERDIECYRGSGNNSKCVSPLPTKRVSLNPSCECEFDYEPDKDNICVIISEYRFTIFVLIYINNSWGI